MRNFYIDLFIYFSVKKDDFYIHLFNISVISSSYDEDDFVAHELHYD